MTIALLIGGALALAQLGGMPPQTLSPQTLPPQTLPRVRTVRYNAEETVSLPVPVGFAAVVELDPDEAVDSVVVGNSTAWQVTTNKRGDRVIVKPVGDAAATDMIVVTDVHRYVFLLQATTAEEPTAFVLRFVYPDTATARPVLQSFVADYRLRGAKALFPALMRDDGHRTTVIWDRQTRLPAIFAVDATGHESLVNGRMEADGYVIQGIAARYVFRLDKAQATATRRLLAQPR